MTQIVVNRQNNMGDAMNQMRVLLEYKQRNPGTKLDFISNHYLHYLMATHTDIFENILFTTTDEVNGYAAGWQSKGYERMIEFTVDWGRACEVGIMRAWSEHTLGFAPSTDKPYFILTEEEKVTAKSQHGIIMTHPQANKPSFRKSMVLNLESVSAYTRGFRVEDFNMFIDLIPSDVAIFYMAPITWIHGNPFAPRPNLIVMPGYPIGHTAAMMQCVDLVMCVHSGPLMLALAVDVQHIVEINFNEGGSPQLVTIPPNQGEKVCIENNRSVDWTMIRNLIAKHLA